MVQVTVRSEGSVVLDNRPGEAFKPLLLSSMHVSDTLWDTQAAYACLRSTTIPAGGWIFDPPAYVTLFGVEGGTSDWQQQMQQGRPAPPVKSGYTGALASELKVTTQEGPQTTARTTVCANLCLTYLPIVLKSF